MSAQLPVRSPVEINAGKTSPTVEIVWDDGHRSLYKVGKLREICPCASCREGTEKAAKQSGDKPRRSLPMFKSEKYQIADMHYVGRYALGITWVDKHDSIFPWAFLSEECPCEQCTARREATAGEKDLKRLSEI